jgi:DNA-binding transcriptional ArsR family regulator
MSRTAWLPLAVLLAATLPLAAAGYGEGSALDVASPASVEGQADTLLPSGIASFVSPSASNLVGVLLEADEAAFAVFTYYEGCAPGAGIPGIPSTEPCGGAPGEPEAYVLTDARVTVTRAVSAYKVLVTTDRNYADSATWSDAGDLISSTGATTKLATNAEPVFLSMTDEDWTSDSARRPYEPYTVDAGSAQFLANGGVLRALDGFELFLQGVQVTITGTDEEGNEVSETFDPREAGDGANAALAIEVSGGDLTASSSAPFTGYAPSDQRPITDVHGKARFTGATGTVNYAGDERGRQEFTDSPVDLEGPLSLQLVEIKEGRLSYAIVDGLQLGALADTPETDEPIPPAALAAAGAAGAGGAGLLIALAYFWPRLKYAWTLTFLPMYTRIERDSVLEHEKRDELYELIRATPGIHAHEIGEKAHIGWGTTVYHLKLLENHGLIVSKKSGRYKRFFVNTGEYTKKKDIYGALRNETAKSVADYVVNHPGTTQKELCAALGIQPSLASWHVEKLEGVELVKRVKDGRMVRYFAGPAWADLNVRVNPVTGAPDTPVET